MNPCPSCGREVGGDFQFCPYCGAALAPPAPAREQRKVVTALFCDVVGSTALGESTDPEALRTLLARYFERMRAIVERHGGSVEKFVGDAVMAVFGVPVVHEDDALRALRAAVEMRDALPELGVQGRIGVTTGEVVTGTEERLATGDAVNVAARLEQAAQPGEILIGQETLRLTHDAVGVEALAPLELKGKSEPVAAYRLLSVHGDEGIARQAAAAMVGRQTELRRLRDAYDQSVGDRSCQLFTVLGTAGVGKSRLVAEFLASVDGSLTVRGRCLPYGEGITYWPVIEVVKQLPAAGLDAAAAQAIGAVLGEEPLVTSGEEIAWAFRKLLEAVAAERPLVVVFDDIHWGEETFLDLLEHVADLSRDAPILLLCIARPELLERRAGWAGGKVNATTLLLEPLGADDANLLIDSLGHLEEGLRARIRDAAEGNPLFVEQMVAYAQASPGHEVTVPPTIQALLAARLDQLDDGDRAVLERGAVEGRVFHRRAVEALAPDEAHVGSRLTSLVRKELVRPDKPQLAGDDAFRFRHLLIRDAAYDSLPKAKRAELHEQFAFWLEEHGTDLVELDEIAGYHLEQAHRYRLELGPSDARSGRLAAGAAGRLADAGRRALVRGDVRAAVQLLERAAALLPGEGRVLALLGRALLDAGDWRRSAAVLDEAIESAHRSGDEVGAADASITRAYLRLHTDPGSRQDAVRALLARAAAVFESAGDDAGLARTLGLSGLLAFWRGEVAAAMVELELSARHARDAGERMQEFESTSYLMLALVTGPTPVEEALARIDETAGASSGGRRQERASLASRARLEAMRGRFETARLLAREAAAISEELGLALSGGLAEGEIALLEGDYAAAEQVLRATCEEFEERGDIGHFTSVAPFFADAVLALGRGGEARRALDLAAQWAIAEDVDAQVGIRRTRAQLLALDGELVEAERLAREAVAIASRTDYLPLCAKAHAALGEVLERAGDRDGAAAAFAESVACSERKGDLVTAARTRERLEALGAPAVS